MTPGSADQFGPVLLSEVGHLLDVERRGAGDDGAGEVTEADREAMLGGEDAVGEEKHVV